MAALLESRDVVDFLSMGHPMSPSRALVGDAAPDMEVRILSPNVRDALTLRPGQKAVKVQRFGPTWEELSAKMDHMSDLLSSSMTTIKNQGLRIGRLEAEVTDSILEAQNCLCLHAR